MQLQISFLKNIVVEQQNNISYYISNNKITKLLLN